jgi:hypothetical protein
MGLAAQYGHAWLRDAVPGDTLLIRVVHVFGAIGIGLLVFGGAAFLLRVREVGAALQRLTGRFRR